MSVESHIQQLERKHKALEDAISLEQRRPAGDDLKVVELKRQKLKIKDEMNRLNAGLSH